MKAVVAALNQEKALVGAFSVLTHLRMELFQALYLIPQDQTAAEGEHVTLPCRVDNKVGNLQWTRDDFGLGLNRNLKGFER